jgi:hypothetical protein
MRKSVLNQHALGTGKCTLVNISSRVTAATCSWKIREGERHVSRRSSITVTFEEFCTVEHAVGLTFKNFSDMDYLK